MEKETDNNRSPSRCKSNRYMNPGPKKRAVPVCFRFVIIYVLKLAGRPQTPIKKVNTRGTTTLQSQSVPVCFRFVIIDVLIVAGRAQTPERERENRKKRKKREEREERGASQRPKGTRNKKHSKAQEQAWEPFFVPGARGAERRKRHFKKP